jgi:hypothetical protein
VWVLAPVHGEPGAYLLPAVARAYKRLCDEVERRHGWRPRLTSIGDAYRSRTRQITVFTQRYGKVWARVLQLGRWIVDRRVWDLVPFWRHTGAAAAVPGTSNHGEGTTVDVQGLGGYSGERFRQFAAVARAQGWVNDVPAEAWHWRYTGPDAFTVDSTVLDLPTLTVTAPVATLPDPITPTLYGDDDMPTLLFSPQFGWAVRDGGARAVPISAQSTVDAYRGSHLDAEQKPIPGLPPVRIVRVDDPRDFLRAVEDPTVGLLLYCPPDLGGLGWAFLHGGEAQGIGEQRLVDELRGRGAPVQIVGADDFRRFLGEASD